MSTRLNPRKLIRFAAATRVLGGLLAERAKQHYARPRIVRVGATRARWTPRLAQIGRNPLLAGAAAVAAAILAFMVLGVVLGAVFVLLAVLFKLALAVVLGVMLYRWLRPSGRRGLEVIVVPSRPSRL